MAETGLRDRRRRKLPANAVSASASASGGPGKMGSRSSPDHGPRIRQWQNGTRACGLGTAPRTASPSAIRCCTLVGIALAASSWDQSACAANSRRRRGRAGPGFRGSARRCMTMNSYSAWLCVSALPVAEPLPQAGAQSSLVAIDFPRPSSRVSCGRHGRGSHDLGPERTTFHHTSSGGLQ